jgi:methylated-DNA-protein-cysteine methyltransferase-like protein
MPNTPDPSQPARTRTAGVADATQAILAAIRAVPHGQVAGYGMIARRAGLPGRARLVARVLGHNDDHALPWHRILRSDGRIAFPADSPGFAEQARRLRAEGVEVRNGKVRMPAGDLLAEGGLDAEVWSPR